MLDILQAIPAGDRGTPRGYAELELNAAVVRGANSTVLVAALDVMLSAQGREVIGLR